MRKIRENRESALRKEMLISVNVLRSPPYSVTTAERFEPSMVAPQRHLTITAVRPENPRASMSANVMSSDESTEASPPNPRRNKTGKEDAAAMMISRTTVFVGE